MKLLVIDGQGGKMGKAVIEHLKRQRPDIFITAVGTNSIATSAMVKAGADNAATGENPVLVNSSRADIIIGPIGIVMANSLLGEITPSMACAISSSRAYKILIPVNRCGHFIVGCAEQPLGIYIREVIEKVDEILSGGRTD
mgnify:CR=1 FL=1